MPLYTQILREDRLVPLRWSLWHIAMMKAAAAAGGVDIMATGTYTVPPGEYFAVSDTSDQEQLWLLPGDRLEIFR